MPLCINTPQAFRVCYIYTPYIYTLTSLCDNAHYAYRHCYIYTSLYIYTLLSVWVGLSTSHLEMSDVSAYHCGVCVKYFASQALLFTHLHSDKHWCITILRQGRPMGVCHICRRFLMTSLADHEMSVQHTVLMLDSPALAPGDIPWIRLTYGPMVQTTDVFHQMFPLEAGYHYRRHRALLPELFGELEEDTVTTAILDEVGQITPVIVHRQHETAQHNLYIGVPGMESIYQL